MIRLFVEQDLSENQEIIIIGKDHHYLCNVMRSKVGGKIILVNGKQGEWEGEIIKINKREIILIIAERLKIFYQPPFLGLVFVPTQKVDLLCKNATELGVTEFQPVYSTYMYKSKIKLDKLRANIKEAVEQSERTDFPEVKNIVKLNDFFNSLKAEDIVLFCEERTGENDAFSVLNKLRSDGVKLGGKAKVYVLVGAEGGFSKEEKVSIKKCPNIISLSLGERILRAETAVSSVLSVVQSFLYL